MSEQHTQTLASASVAVPHGAFRDRVYANYVSAFKGRPQPERLRGDFDRRAKMYDWLLAPVIKDRTIGRMCEVACGQGPLLYWAKKRRIPDVAGCDVSAEQVAVARELGLPAETISYQDFLPRFERSCDLVVGQDIIEHVTRDEVLNFLDLCFRALAPGGILFLTTPNGAAWRAGNVQHGDLTHETIFTPDSIRSVLTLAGFEQITVREVSPPPTSWRSRVRAALWRLLRIWPMVVDIVETGWITTPVLTRVMAVSGHRPLDS